MKPSTGQKLFNFSFIASGIIFIFNGFEVILQAKFILAAIQLLAGIGNLLMLKKHSDRSRHLLNYLLYLLNIGIALAIAMDYINAGKKHLQFAWFFVALISLAAAVLYFKKSRRPGLNGTLK